MRPKCDARLLHDLNLFPIQHAVVELPTWKVRPAFEFGTAFFSPVVWQLSQARNDFSRGGNKDSSDCLGSRPHLASGKGNRARGVRKGENLVVWAIINRRTKSTPRHAGVLIFPSGASRQVEGVHHRQRGISSRTAEDTCHWARTCIIPIYYRQRHTLCCNF